MIKKIGLLIVYVAVLVTDFVMTKMISLKLVRRLIGGKWYYVADLYGDEFWTHVEPSPWDGIIIKEENYYD